MVKGQKKKVAIGLDKKTNSKVQVENDEKSKMRAERIPKEEEL